jgi:hypothetical protein
MLRILKEVETTATHLTRSALLCTVTSHVLGHRWGPELEGRECDNVLRDPHYRTPQEAEVNEYTAMMKGLLRVKLRRNSEKNFLRSHFARNEVIRDSAVRTQRVTMARATSQDSTTSAMFRTLCRGGTRIIIDHRQA